MTARIPTLKKKDMIREVQDIIGSYRQKMTLRQIYYRLVARNLIENVISQYKRLSSVLVWARKNGHIDPRAMEDRHRTSAKVPNDEYVEVDDHFNAWLDAFLNLEKRYHLPKWYKQPIKVIVSLEKDALSGVFSTVTSSTGAGLIVGKGYNSYTQIYDLARKLERFDETTEKVVLLYFGDFDPTGKDIIRSLQERLEEEYDGVELEHHLIALTHEQIKQWDLPPAPTKKTDSRASSFIARYGDRAVELDAIEPTDLQVLIRDNITPHYDTAIYEDVQEEQKENREVLKEMTDKAKETLELHCPEFFDEDDDDDEEDGDLFG